MRWVIGDIHGMLGPLRTLLEMIRRADRDPHLLFVGDYVNRGPDSRGVIELLLSLPNAKFVRGNHDDVFDLVLHETCYAAQGAEAEPLAAFQWFSQHGLIETFLSYGVDRGELEFVARRPSQRGLRQIVKAVPEAHKGFVRSLPAYVEEPDLFVLHAWWAPDEATQRPGIGERLGHIPEMRRAVIWERYTQKQIEQEKAWERRGFFGHTPVVNYRPVKGTAAAVPIVGPKIVLVDTAAALGTFGRLTAYCVETDRYVQADHHGNAVEDDA